MASKVAPKTNIAPVNARIGGVIMPSATAPASKPTAPTIAKAAAGRSSALTTESLINDQATPVAASTTPDVSSIVEVKSLPVAKLKSASRATVANANAAIPGDSMPSAAAPASKPTAPTIAKAAAGRSRELTTESLVNDQATPVAASTIPDIFSIVEVKSSPVT